jgi:hypothetical protein
VTTYSIILFDDSVTPPDISRNDIINIEAPWDLVEGLAKLALAKYSSANRVVAVNENGIRMGEWQRG